MYETHARTLAKTIAWRILASLITLSTVYFYTEKLTESLEVTSIGAFIAMFAYYLHERVWNSIRWGRIEK